MTNRRTYFDFNATSPLVPEARAAMIAALEVVGNASSVHAEGRRARALVDEARHAVADLINAKPGNVVFTSGATEANAWVLSGAVTGAWDRLLISATEHQSVLSPAEQLASRSGVHVERVPVSPEGKVELDLMTKRGDGLGLFALQIANNETGILQNVARAVEIGAELGFVVHTDAAQAAGRIPVDFATLGVASLSLSAHKMGGPKGIGALVIRDGVTIAPLIAGGGQERRRRGGTENTAAIAGFGAAAKVARSALDTMARVRALRDALERDVMRLTPDAIVIGAGSDRLPNTSCIALPGRSAELMVIKLDLAGIAVSAGAACSSGKVAESHVLSAMGLAPDLASSAVRVSFGTTTSDTEIAAFLAAWTEVSKAGRIAA